MIKNIPNSKLYSLVLNFPSRTHFPDLNFQHLKNMCQMPLMRPLLHKSLTLDKHPSTVSVFGFLRKLVRPSSEGSCVPSPHPPINVPSSYRFFNRAPYCRRCIPSDRGIVRVSRERSRLIRHRKTG